MSTSAWPFGAYPPRGLDPLGPNVTAYHAGGFPASNSAIVRGRDATLVFDANCFRFADELRAAVDEAGPPVRDLVLSHAHDDHTMGAERFAPPARVLARASACERLQRNVVEGSVPGVQYERGYPGAAEEGRRVRIVVPEREIERPETVELGGGVRVHLRPEEPAHTDGDLWAFVEPDDVILCGDLWYVDCEPYVGSGSVRGLLRAIGRIREAGARVHLPGHGPAGRLGSASTDPVERHLAWVLDEAERAVGAGLSGVGLREEIGRRFDEQRSRPGGLDFPVRIPGFLQVTASAAERDVLARSVDESSAR